MAEALRLDSLLEAVALAAQRTSPSVRVVGGAGLALLLGHRKSEDLDLFCTRGEEIDPNPMAQEIGCAARVGSSG